MVFDPNAALEILRHHLHAAEPDLIELDALLGAASTEPEFALLQDYLTGQVAQLIDAEHPQRWNLALLRHRHAAEHPQTPPLFKITALLAGAQVTEAGVLDWLTLLLRQHGLVPGDLARWIAAAVAAEALPAEEVAALTLTALTATVATTPAGSITHTPVRICTVVRGTDSWGAPALLARLAPEARITPERHTAVFTALSEAIYDQGAPWLVDRARLSWIATRDVRYSPAPDYAQVMTMAAAVAELSLHRDRWPEPYQEAIHDRWVDIATHAMSRVGVRLSPNTSTPHLEADATLYGPDGSLALQYALATAESLLAVGAHERAQQLARQVLAAINALGAPHSDRRWAMRLI